MRDLYPPGPLAARRTRARAKVKMAFRRISKMKEIWAMRSKILRKWAKMRLPKSRALRKKIISTSC